MGVGLPNPGVLDASGGVHRDATEDAFLADLPPDARAEKSVDLEQDVRVMDDWRLAARAEQQLVVRGAAASEPELYTQAAARFAERSYAALTELAAGEQIVLKLLVLLELGA